MMTDGKKNENITYDVIVVGGGFCGVSTAIQLQDTGKVLLLEAQDHLGGRAHSITSTEGHIIDLGCHFVGIKHRRVMSLIQQLGMTGQLMDYVAGFGPDPRGICHMAGKTISSKTSDNFFGIQGLDSKSALPEKLQLISLLLGIMIKCDGIDPQQPWKSISAEHLDSISFTEFVETEVNGSEWMKDLTLSGVRGAWSQDPERMSALYVLWYMRSNGGLDEIFCDQQDGPQQYGLRCGLGGLLKVWVKKELRAEVKLNSPVKSIAVDDDSGITTIHTLDGQTYKAKKVVCTASPAVCDKIQFTPALPPARQLLHKQNSGFAIKATVFYDKPWWRDSLFGGQFFAVLNGQDVQGVDWILEASEPQNNYHAIIVFIKPDWYDLVKDDEEGNVTRDQLGDAICRAVKQDPRAKDISHFEIKDWRRDPYTGGGPNTNFEVGVLTNIGSVFNKPDHNESLYFAGAEYSQEYTGYVEGAIASGQFVAKQILEGQESESSEITKKGRIRWFAVFMKLFIYYVLLVICLYLGKLGTTWSAQRKNKLLSKK